MKQDIETKVKDCTACPASGKSPKHQLPKRHYGKLEKLFEPRQEIQTTKQKIKRRNTNTYCGR